MTEETFTEKIRIYTLFLIGIIIGYIFIKYAIDIYGSWIKMQYVTHRLYCVFIELDNEEIHKTEVQPSTIEKSQSTES